VEEHKIAILLFYEWVVEIFLCQQIIFMTENSDFLPKETSKVFIHSQLLFNFSSSTFTLGSTEEEGEDIAEKI
jgi:hypothetical protein